MVWYPPNREIALEVSDRFTSSFVLDEYSDGTQFSLLMRRASGVWLRATQVDVAQLNATLVKGDGARSIFEALRESLSRAPIQRLQGNIGAVIAGICYGADETLSSEATAAFRTCGVSHLFAVSGLHMTVLLQALQWLLRRMRVRRVARLIVCGAFLLGFMLIVGFSSSVVRAGTLCLVVLLGNGIKREADTRNSLGLALLILT
jgi:competence protein ComEC